MLTHWGVFSALDKTGGFDVNSEARDVQHQQ